MYAPQHVLSNADLAQILAGDGIETSDEWIRSRTGIARRRIAGEHESTSQMAIEAARAALRVADADPRQVDLVIVATTTPDHPFPSTACQVQDAIGARHAGAFDLGAGCSGFVYALTVAHQAIASGEHKLVLVVGADTLSRVVDWSDRATCVLFGDGAGAVLLRSSQGPSGTMATLMGSDGSGGNLLIIPGGGGASPFRHATDDGRARFIHMNGQEVFRFATSIIPEAVEQVMHKASLDVADLQLIVPHQANQRIIASAAKRLKMPLDRFVMNLEDYGNTSAASVPIALCEAIEAGRVQTGHNIVMVGFGAGLTWAAVALKWGISPEAAMAPRWRSAWLWWLYRWASLRSHALQILRRAMVLLIRRADQMDR